MDETASYAITKAITKDSAVRTTTCARRVNSKFTVGRTACNADVASPQNVDQSCWSIPREIVSLRFITKTVI